MCVKVLFLTILALVAIAGCGGASTADGSPPVTPPSASDSQWDEMRWDTDPWAP